MTENPLAKKLEGKKIILASGSPRRQQFFKDFGVDFEVRLKPVDEIYPENLRGAEISDYLSKLKATPFQDRLSPNELLVTSDTVVWHQGESLAKAKDKAEAIEMLSKLSGHWHEVITSVSLTTATLQKTINATTAVKFKPLSQAEITYYIDHYQPCDGMLFLAECVGNGKRYAARYSNF